MDEKKLKALAAELAKGLKTEADLNQFSRMLTKLTVETALNAELTDHLGHEKNAPRTGSNSRNGYSSKTLLCDDGEIELNTPRDRENTFEPQLIKKHQTRITQMDSQILSLYAKGMTTREIVATFKEMYDADVSPTLISKVTDAVKEQVTEWQNRQLDALYPIVYLDCIVVKVRQNGSVINKAVFLALGINTEGQKELLDMWLVFNNLFDSFEFELRGKCTFSPTSFDHASPHVHCFNINRISRCPELLIHYNALRTVSLGRKNYLFFGSDHGGER